MNSLGNKLRELRIARYWNQGDVAKQLDISIPAYSKIETGVTDINLSRLQGIAQLYGISVVQLLAGDQKDDDQLASANKKLLEREAQVIRLQKQLIELFEEVRQQKAV